MGFSEGLSPPVCRGTVPAKTRDCPPRSCTPTYGRDKCVPPGGKPEGQSPEKNWRKLEGLSPKNSENAFKEMPTLADKSSDFRFSSGIQIYFWTQRQKQTTNLNAPMIVRHWGQSRDIVGSSRGRHRVPTEVHGGYLARWVVGSSRGGFHFRRSRIQRRRRKSAIAATTARRARR